MMCSFSYSRLVFRIPFCVVRCCDDIIWAQTRTFDPLDPQRIRKVIHIRSISCNSLRIAYHRQDSAYPVIIEMTGHLERTLEITPTTTSTACVRTTKPPSQPVILNAQTISWHNFCCKIELNPLCVCKYLCTYRTEMVP
jgi:hypothetical protein